MHDQASLPKFQAEARAASRSILLTDVSEFYSSIYTHSIPWALHTKAVAKNNKAPALLGNRLDKLVRDSQDGQTMGIPIGPDTSFVLAEVILGAVDEELVRQLRTLTGLRWIDGYELTFSRLSDAEEALAMIQQVLLEYELRINPRKTRIAELPIEFEPQWLTELRSFKFRNTRRGQSYDLIRYFDSMTSYLQEFPNEHVMKYGIARLRTLPVLDDEPFQQLLCQAMVVEPGAVRESMQALYYAQNHYGLVVDSVLLAKAVNAIAEQNAAVGHDYEVSWCLWAALTWTLQISPNAARAISLMENSVVAILALDALASGLFAGGGLDVAHWQGRMATSELYEEQWLLAYEANVQGWLPSVGPGDHVAVDPNFAFLKNLGVRFYTRVVNPFVPGALAYP